MDIATTRHFAQQAQEDMCELRERSRAYTKARMAVEREQLRRQLHPTRAERFADAMNGFHSLALIAVGILASAATSALTWGLLR